MPFKDPEQGRLRKRLLYAERKNAGLCRCGKPPETGTRCSKCLAAARNSVKKCRINLKRYHREYYRKNSQKEIIGSQRYYAANLEKVKAAKKLRHKKLKDQIYDHYGRECACCGENEEMFLTIGHINGDGAAHRRRARGAIRMYLDIVRRGFPDDIRIECHNCNCGSFRNGGICPHQSAKLK
jgi:hypothetical protein